MKEYWQDNKYELITTFFIFTNLFPAWFPQWMYYVAFALILLKMREFQPLGGTNKTGLFWGFIAFLWFTTTVGNALDFRLVIFTFIFYICAPRGSWEWHLYKKKLLFNIFLGFGFATLANFYAKLNGINLAKADKFMESMGRVVEFCGFASHPMWTSCAAAISAVFFSSMAFRDDLRNKWLKWCCYAMILISLYITMIAASRAAFFLSLACSALVIRMQAKEMTTLFRNVFIVGITTVAFAPVLIDNSNAMLHKKNGLEITTKNTSRDELWSQRIAEFYSSPIIGIGFAAHGVGANKVVGRNESGGSFISVLAQAGIIGIIFIALIWAAAIMMPSRVREDPNLILVYASFVFFSIHSIIEGYMFQAGWYLCLVIWLVIGVMIEHKEYGNLYKDIEEEDENEIHEIV